MWHILYIIYCAFVFGEVHFAHLFSFLCCVFCVCLSSSCVLCFVCLRPVSCVLFVFVLCLVYSMFPVSLDCLYLIAPSALSSVYLSCVLCILCFQFLWIFYFWLPLQHCLAFICPVSCVFYVSSFSGLSIFDCPFSII